MMMPDVRALADEPVFGLIRLCLTPLFVLLGIVLFLRTRALEPVGDERASEAPEMGDSAPRGVRKAWLITFVVLGFGAAACVWMKIYAGPPEGLEWSLFPYLDKRWIVLAYWLGAFGIAILPLLIARLLPTRSVLEVPEPAPSRASATGGIAAVAARAGFGVVLATALFGPPWNTDASTRPIDAHEQIHWSGLQALEHGYVPYLGAASVNYGPGMQLVTHAYMKGTDQFSVPGFRETFGLSLWIALALVYAALFAMLRFPRALVTALLVLIVSPVALWTWSEQGSLDGFFGWANALRVVGPLLLALGLSGLIRTRRSTSTLAVRATGLGFSWGFLAYYAQQNLSGGLLTMGAILAIAWATRTIDGRACRTLGLFVGLGFVVACLPVVVFYIAKGSLLEFWHNYSLVPSRFVRGYANTAYAGSLDRDPWAVAYYTLPYLVPLVALLALYRARPLAVAAPLGGGRLLSVTACIAFLASYPSALLRADSWHLVGTLFALPLVITVALIHLPEFLTRSSARRWIVRGTVLLVVTNIFLPVFLNARHRLAGLLEGRWRSFSVDVPTLPTGADTTLRRLGLVQGATVGARLQLLQRTRAVVGDRPTYVHTSRFVYAGYVYFLADLNPAPIWLERFDMVADDALLRQFLEHFEANIDGVDAIVSLTADSEEIQIFKSSCKGFTTREVTGPGYSLYVYLRD